MFNGNLLRGKIVEMGMTQKMVAKFIGITQSSWCSKMKAGTFFRREIEQIMLALNLDISDAIRIFFAPNHQKLEQTVDCNIISNRIPVYEEGASVPSAQPILIRRDDP